LQTISEIQKEITIIWPIHPRAKKRIEEFGLDELVKKSNNIILVSPLGYFEMLGLTKYAKLVLTDSGGIQEETTVLKIPCLTLRRSTERPVTVSVGTNKIVGDDTQKIIKESKRVIKAKKTEGNIPKYWDGKTAGRIVKVLKQEYGKRI
jgi:UDP-N-acetylglucosamine 2-epimerase (non-hydrolysing)